MLVDHGNEGFLISPEYFHDSESFLMRTPQLVFIRKEGIIRLIQQTFLLKVNFYIYFYFGVFGSIFVFEIIDFFILLAESSIVV